MNVDVFYSNELKQIAITPCASSPILPGEFNEELWQHLMRTTLDDKFLAAARPIIEAEIGVMGFSALRLMR